MATDGISGAVSSIVCLTWMATGIGFILCGFAFLAHGGWVNELMWKNFDLNVLVISQSGEND
ncbi:MAG: hypothetical protein ACLUN1_01570 [Odoribacter splanchnicus]